MALKRDGLLKPVKKLRKLLKKLDNEPAAKKIHALRTQTRRLDAIVEALSLEVGKSTLKDLGRLRRRAGEVRDMDVLIGFASVFQPRGEEKCGKLVLDYLGARRKKIATKLHAEARRSRRELRRHLKQIGASITTLLRKNKTVVSKNSPAVKATGAAAKLAVQLGTPEHLNRSNLHPYRLKIKELQNVLRMGSPSPHPRFAMELSKLKDVIGEWHDWEELASIAEEVLKHKRCGFKREVKPIASQKYRDAIRGARRFRKTYLRDARVPRPAVWDAAAGLTD